MKLRMQRAFSTVAIVFSVTAAASAQTSNPLPSVNDVVAKMMQSDAQRQSELAGYTAMRRYIAVNNGRHAEMLVHVACDKSGAKEFSIVSEDGSGSIRKHVFHKMLSEESEASRHGTRNSTRITPANYDFQFVGKDTLDTGPAYILEISPRTENKYLIRGRIWVNANDYSIVRIEGQPARNPSFWVEDAHFVHTYQKVGQFWLASSTRTTSEIRIFGDSELTIENSDYKLTSPVDYASDSDNQARLNP